MFRKNPKIGAAARPAGQRRGDVRKAAALNPGFYVNIALCAASLMLAVKLVARMPSEVREDETLRAPKFITLPEEAILEVLGDPAKMVERDPNNGPIKFSESESFPGKKPPKPESLKAFKRCFVVGRHPDTPLGPDDDELQMNSRTFCHMGPVCFDQVDYDIIHDFSGSEIDCAVVGADSGRTNDRDTAVLKEVIGCKNLVKSHIGHLYGAWTMEEDTSWIRDNRKQIVWHPMGVVVPKYDYQFNICHVNRMMAFASHAVWNAEVYNMTKPASVHVRGEGLHKTEWGAGIGRMLHNVLLPTYFLRQTSNHKHHCFTEVALLGGEGRFDAMPFLNDSDVITSEEIRLDTHIPRIPLDALRYHATVYAGMGLPPVIVESHDAARSKTGDKPGRPDVHKLDSLDVLRVALPPRKLVLVDRGETVQRRFDTHSSEAIMDILNRVTRENNFTLATYSFDHRTFDEQVSMMRDVGITIGIHGANIQNSVFAPAAGALMEIFPYMYTRAYYVGGGNSGLRYSFHEVQSGAYHNCDDLPRYRKIECGLRYRNDILKLKDEEFAQIEHKVRRMVAYIEALHSLGDAVELKRSGQRYELSQAEAVLAEIERRTGATG